MEMNLVLLFVFSFVFLFLFLYLFLKQRSLKEDVQRSFQDMNGKIEEMNRNLPGWVEGAVLKTFQSSSGIFENVFASAISKNAEVIKGAFATSIKELGIQEDVGKLKEASSDLKSLTADLKSMFEVKQSRAKFGELQLEMLLRDTFPQNRLHFQRNIPKIGTPDACILVESKYLCIDSKFPLENFKKYVSAESEEERRRCWDAFVKDVKRHIQDVRAKYVGRENTFDFAFLFVPSDAIFYHLIGDAPEVVVEASKAGVVLASPMVLPAYLNLVSARIRAEEISERADEIQAKINGMVKYIEDLESKLNTTTRHVVNAYNSIGKTSQSFERMKDYFMTISSLNRVKVRR